MAIPLLINNHYNEHWLVMVYLWMDYATGPLICYLFAIINHTTTTAQTRATRSQNTMYSVVVVD